MEARDPADVGGSWLDLWAWATSADGLWLTERQFWRLTPVEYEAKLRVWRQARGIKPPLTKEEKERLAWNQAYILEQQRRALNKEAERQKKLKVVQMERRKAHGRG